MVDELPDTYYIIDTDEHRFYLDVAEAQRIEALLSGERPLHFVKGVDYFNGPFLLAVGNIQCLFLSSPDIRDSYKAMADARKQWGDEVG